MTSRPKIGLALGSGAARGLAHIGVIKALMKNEIPIDYVAGCSSGALVGAFFCCGIDMDLLTKIAKSINKDIWVDVVVSKKGIIAGKKAEEFIRILTKDKCFEDLQIPFRVVATDLRKSQQYVFERGSIWKAVRASISIPGIFCPVEIDDMILVDGGVLNRVPAETVREMGADIVIAVDVGVSMVEGKFNNFFEIIMQCIDAMEKEIVKNRIISADICIRPKIININPLDFTQVDLCVAEGERAANEAIPQIKDMIERFSYERTKIGDVI